MANSRAYQEIPLTFEKGQVIEVEDSALELGEATEILNWEPSARGLLRARNAWAEFSTNGLPPAPYKVRGISSIATDASAGGGGTELELVQSASVFNTAERVETVSLTGVTVGNQLFVTLVTNNATAPPTVNTPGWAQLFAADNSPSGDYKVTFWTKEAESSNEELEADAVSGAMQIMTMYEVANCNASADGTGFETNVSGSGGSTVAINVADTDGGIVFHGGGTTQSGTLTGWATSADVTGFVTDVSTGNQRTSHAFYSGADATLQNLEASYSSIGTYAIRVMAVGANPSEAQSPEASQYYIVIALAVNDLEYEIYRILRDQVTTGTWELIDTGTSSDTTSFVTFAQGGGYLNWSASTMATPRKILLSGPTGSDVTDLASKSGRAYAYHKDRLFSAGSSANPYRLYFSAIGDPNEFGSLDYIDIGGNDGEAIQELVSVEGLLLVCKANRLYLISGSGIESFFVNELPGGTTAPGRSAARSPYGTIVAGPDDVWVVQGGAVDPLSRPLGENYTIIGNASVAYAQDSAFVLDSGTNDIFRINLVTGAWSMENVEGEDAAPGLIHALNGRLYYGVLNDEVLGGTRRLSSERTHDAQADSTIFSATTGKISMFGPSFRYTPRNLFLQTRLQSASLPASLSMTITTNLGSEDKSFQITELAQRHRESLGSYKGVDWIQVSFNAASSATHSAFNIERAVLGVQVESQ